MLRSLCDQFQPNKFQDYDRALFSAIAFVAAIAEKLGPLSRRRGPQSRWCWEEVERESESMSLIFKIGLPSS